MSAIDGSRIYRAAPELQAVHHRHHQIEQDERRQVPFTQVVDRFLPLVAPTTGILRTRAPA
jgi:hypothetical protein